MNNDTTMNEDLDMTEEEVKQVADAVDRAAVLEKLADLQKQLDQMKSAPKNQRPGKANDKNHYKLLSKVMESWGNVPDQQRDLAKILAGSMELGKEYTETEVFAMLVDGCGEFPSLTRSRQDVTYLFRYYRGIKKTAKYGSFVGRNFLRVI